MFVKTVDTLVFVALTQHLIQSTMRCENSTLLCIKWPLSPAKREGYLYLYKGDCRQDAQPIPNS